jgi:RNase P protein component
VRIVVHARPSAAEASFDELREEYRALLSRGPESRKSGS